MPDLDGKIILITGAAKRIGRILAIEAHKRGAIVAIHYHHSEALAKETAGECGGSSTFQANLESVEEIRGMFAAIRERYGRLDGLVNNAARFTRFDPLAITEADWDFIHNVNLKATFFCCQEAARLMQSSGGGRIVNMSSLGGIRPWGHHAHYCASKAGVIMLTKALAKAWAPGITVNSVAPGVIPMGKSDERIERLICATPAGRAGRAEEIAEAVMYFLSGPDFVTGQVMAVDGGLSLR